MADNSKEKVNKTMYIIGGTLGVGKSSVSEKLRHILPASVYLDGDWCWDMFPMQVTNETRDMVFENICHILNNFLRCSVVESIIFSWYLPQKEMIDKILSGLDYEPERVVEVILTCDKKVLEKRLKKELKCGVRTDSELVEKGLELVPMYEKLDIKKVDTSHLSPYDAAYIISKMA
ncbi:MAG: AAA family ATPase [Clostridia bacterium]|nr:AAA family ATPase [Clostridia bacterium]